MERQHYFGILLILEFAFVGALAQNQVTEEQTAMQSFRLAPSYFIANTANPKNGKRLVNDHEVTAFVQTQKGRVLFTPSGAYIGISVPFGEWRHNKPEANRRAKGEGSDPSTIKTRTVVMKAGFSTSLAKQRQIMPRLEAPTSSTVNYFVGPRENWRTEVPTYRKLVYDEVWNGITLEYLGFMDHLAFQLVLEPGSYPDQIVMETGAE